MRSRVGKLVLISRLCAFAGLVAPCPGRGDLGRAIVPLCPGPGQFVKHVAVGRNRAFGRVAKRHKLFVGKVFDILKANGAVVR
jgi:hypothetical protein